MAEAPDVDVSSGITIAFGTSAFSAEITDVNGPGMSREALDTSHQGTTTYRTFTPSDLVDPGNVTFTIHFNPDTNPPIATAAETITITWPAEGTWAFTGFVTSYTPAAPLGQLMTGDIELKVSGEITMTDGSASGSGSGSGSGA